MSSVVDEIRDFYRTRRSQVDRKKNLTDEMGQTLSDFVERTELNKTATGIMQRLDKLSPEKREDVLRSIDTIREAMEGVWSQETTEQMDFDKGSTGVAAAQQFERERKPGRKKKAEAPLPPETSPHPEALVPTPHELAEASEEGAGFNETSDDGLEFLDS